jgi:phosphohistidine phosphatase SixA
MTVFVFPIYKKGAMIKRKVYYNFIFYDNFANSEYKTFIMNRILFVLLLCSIGLNSYGQTFYIVRHAEKSAPDASMGSDVTLSAAGIARAEALKQYLADKNIAYVFSTKTKRTESTARPTASQFGVTVENYGPRPDSAFIQLLNTKDKNTLVVGHSNTIDDVVNMLCGKILVDGDLPETEYDNLFIIEKQGNIYTFTKVKFGKPSVGTKADD